MVWKAAGAMAAPMFMESLVPMSTMRPVVIPVILASPSFRSPARATHPAPVTVQVADMGRWLPYASGKRNSFSAVAKWLEAMAST